MDLKRFLSSDDTMCLHPSFLSLFVPAAVSYWCPFKIELTFFE